MAPTAHGSLLRTLPEFSFCLLDEERDLPVDKPLDAPRPSAPVEGAAASFELELAELESANKLGLNDKHFQKKEVKM